VHRLRRETLIASSLEALVALVAVSPPQRGEQIGEEAPTGVEPVYRVLQTRA
jgi:hypothetical protein